MTPSMSAMTIIRVEHNKDNPYVPIHRATLLDLKLDLQAKGLLAFLLGKPDDWRIRPKALAKEVGVSFQTVYRILDRMIKAGYVHHEIIRCKKDGRFLSGSMYIIFESKEYKREWQDRSRFSGADRYGPIPF